MLFPLEIGQFVTTKRKGGKRNPTNFRRNQFPISPAGEAVMGFRVGTRAIRPTYQLRGTDMKTQEIMLVSACFGNIISKTGAVGTSMQHVHKRV